MFLSFGGGKLCVLGFDIAPAEDVEEAGGGEDGAEGGDGGGVVDEVEMVGCTCGEGIGGLGEDKVGEDVAGRDVPVYGRWEEWRNWW